MKQMNDYPSFFSILTAEVRYNKQLSSMEKLLFSEITALTNYKGFCYANNSYFEFVFGVSRSTIQRALRNLEKQNVINIELEKNEKKQVLKRKIFVLIDKGGSVKNTTRGSIKNDTRGGVENDTYNNTREKENNINLNTNVNTTRNSNFKNRNKRPDVNPDWLEEYLREQKEI